MDSPIRARILVSGRVQGVAYRAFTRDAASRMKLCGGVRNVDDGRVEVDVEGERQVVEAFIELLRTGPPMARVDDLQVRWDSPTGQHKDFRIWY
ncbi:MAG: acylphosphatase [Nitrospirae bacterium]|nr:MAG: acylphosphatase [Nitrospirota bacterium]